MTLKEMIQICKLGNLGKHEKMPGLFKWHYADNQLYYELDGKSTRFDDLKESLALKTSNKFWYIT